MKFSYSQRLNRRVAVFKILQLSQVELNCINIPAFNWWHIFQPSHIVARHPAILQGAGIVRGTSCTIGSQKPLNRELSKQILITVQKATRDFLLNID